MALSGISTNELRDELLRRQFPTIPFKIGEVSLYLSRDKGDVVLKSEKGNYTQIEIRFCADSQREKPVAIYGTTKNTHFEWFDVYG